MRTLIITFFGLGFLPIASGTWGSAGAVLAVAPVLWLVPHGLALNLVLVGLILLVCVLSVALGPWAVRQFAGKDPKQFVLDEVAGQWVALLWLPMGDARMTAVVVGSQFLLFRVFDIVKPPPARRLERLPHGWGILLDDVMAGVYANLVGQVVFRCLWA